MSECCSRCCNPLNEEEVESPRQDSDGDIVCDECYSEKYEFACCCCQEYGNVKDQHNLLVVFEMVSEVLPGIYRITDDPYHCRPLIGEGSLYADCLERIADVNPGMDGNGYPCGHLCLECQSKVAAQFAGKCSECKHQSASCLRVKVGHWKDFEAHEYRWSRPKILCAACRRKTNHWELVAKRVLEGTP